MSSVIAVATSRASPDTQPSRLRVQDTRSPDLVPADRIPPELRLAIEYVALSDVTAYRRELRRHPKKQVQLIAESIRAFGFILPLLVDESGVIIAGHAQLAAAKLLGLAEVPIARLVHLDEPQARALRLALNRLGEMAQWNEQALALEFKELEAFDATLDLTFSLDITGFSSPERDRIIDLGSAEDPADEAVPEVAPTAVSRLGDLWLLGSHRLLCGDSRDAAGQTKLCGDEQATMGIHDFPYDVAISGHVSKPGLHREFVMGAGELGAAFTPFLADVLTATTSVLRPGAYTFAFMDWRSLGKMLDAGGQAGLALKNVCVWSKGEGGMGSLYRSAHEFVFVFQDPSEPGINNVQLGRFGRNRLNVWEYPGAKSLHKERKLHPTPKPVSLVADAIRDVSNRGDIVLDCFSGSGTTIIAAAKTGRRGYAVELDPLYVDVAIRRWQAWSGEEARHADTGLTFAETERARDLEDASPPRTSLADPAPAATNQTFRVRRRAGMAA